MAAVEMPRVAPLGDAPEPHTAAGGQDDEDLGIYEDEAECADLSDSELEDLDSSQNLGSNRAVKSSGLHGGISVIREEDEPPSAEDDANYQESVGSFQLTLPPPVDGDDIDITPPLLINPEDSTLMVPSSSDHDVMKTDLPDLRECPGVRSPPPRHLPVDGAETGDKPLLSVSKQELQSEYNPGSSSTTDMAYGIGLGGKTNTPVSFLTEVNGQTESRILVSRDGCRLSGESREAIYRQAVSLMSSRCLGKLDNRPWMNPFGIPDPEYFYIEQNKPAPMPPLKAWRGYNGNVYFEPIKVSHVSGQEANHDAPRPSSRSRLSYSDLAVTQGTRHQPSPLRSSSVGQYPVKISTSVKPSGARQMSVLDKRTVVNRFNSTIQEDLEWIEGQENTGTLAVTTKRGRGNQSEETPKPRRDRLCKGLVSHKQGLRKKRLPQLSVSGDKFVPPPSTSPLLRTLTQYSLSTARVVNTSPEHGYQKLPPLEHLKATLRSINNSHEDPYRKPVGRSRQSAIREEYNPLVKYSPDVRAKYERHRTKMT